MVGNYGYGDDSYISALQVSKSNINAFEWNVYQLHTKTV